jgi:hypothetical protein
MPEFEAAAPDDLHDRVLANARVARLGLQGGK